MVKIMLSRLLGERKMKQSDLSRKTGIRPNTINGLYHGYAKRIAFTQLEQICIALDCSLCDLIVIEPDEQEEEKHDNKIGHENEDIIIKK